MATYRELIQDIYTRLDKVYDLTGALRDAAMENEKELFNQTRGVLGQLVSQWNRFDNNLPDARAQMKLDWELPDWK